MSHGFKNTMMALLLVAAVYFYVLNERHGDLVDQAMGLCLLDSLESPPAGEISQI